MCTQHRLPRVPLTELQGNRLHTTLTSLKFFLFSRACIEFLSAIQHLSKFLQYDSITTDGVLQTFTATKEKSGKFSSIIDSSVATLVGSLGEDLSYQGEALKVPCCGQSCDKHLLSVVTKALDNN